MKFDPIVVPTEATMIRYFEKGLKPSIKVKIDKDDSQLVNYEGLVTKAIKAKAKIGLQPSYYFWETDLNCLQKNWPAHTTTHKIQT